MNFFFVMKKARSSLHRNTYVFHMYEPPPKKKMFGWDQIKTETGNKMISQVSRDTL